MADDGGERLHVHPVLQGGGGKGVAQIVEANVRQPRVFEDHLQPMIRRAGRRRFLRLYSREKIINKCLEGIRIHGYFSGLLNVLDIFWNDSNISVDTIQNTLLGRLRRYDISEMIFMIQLSSYNFNYEEAMKPDDYKEIDGKNDVLNDVINRFVNEQVREKWESYQIEVNEENKYKLLEWEV